MLGSGGCLSAARRPANPTAHLAEDVLRLVIIADLILQSNLLSLSVVEVLLKHLGLNLAAAGVHLRLKRLELLRDDIRLILDGQVDLIKSLNRIDGVGVVLLRQQVGLLIDQAGSFIVVALRAKAAGTAGC